ncbi:hypothetical protein M422DRAFT_782369 [Sphaerobolus stellatus SS14]|uniref:ATP-dependent bile acid permease n=1 Tax=Sphaerobolus stellatus (strain SS14) TaxID=990650 RepID=A0A0C9UM96_SPHS4|nr:hypothetical protein M422DRAFT_782369 [Sphaerobolus stellatus SS14]
MPPEYSFIHSAITMAFCTVSATSWADDCIQSYFQALPPFLIALTLLLYRIPLPFPKFIQRRTKWLKSLFEDFLPLSEAETHVQAEIWDDTQESTVQKPLLWQGRLFTTLALFETLSWLAIAGYRYSISLLNWFSPNSTPIPFGNWVFDYTMVTPIMNAVSWLPAVIVPMVRPTVTVPFGLLILYIGQFCGAIYRVGSIWYDAALEENGQPVAQAVLMSWHLVVVLVLIFGVMIMPLHVPTNTGIASNIGTTVGPEDYAPLWERMTFEWLLPLIKKANAQTLEETDIWNIPATVQSQPLNEKFSRVRGKSLFKRIWAANSRDMIINFFLTAASAILNFGHPFFLNLILTTLTTFDIDPTSRSKAYIYVFFMFLTSLLKSELDAYNIWFGRRASMRARIELQTAVYTKALVRKDYSGITDVAEEGDAKALSKESGKKSDNANRTAGTGADIGKIVNLMSNDATTVAATIEVLHLLYSGPVSIIIAVTFLYQLLGFSAFSGFIYLAMSTPLSRFFSSRLFRCSKQLASARDKRMKLVNELITTVKLVKFYGWENRWIQRVMESRRDELKWLNKLRMNQVTFIAVALSQPILIAVISFMTFVLIGNSLTIPVAFTALSLFTLLRAPLAILPQWVSQIQSCRVSFERLERFLNEDEVLPEVSSLHESHSQDNISTMITQLSITGNASFVWNSVNEDDSSAAGKTLTVASDAAFSTEPGPSDSVSVTGTQQRFELKSINVLFPEGKLTLVVGPTASGKTALLMALLGEMTMLPGKGKLFLPKHQLRPDEHGNTGLSYAAQSPFLQHLSIRDNILFGSPYEEERYEAVLDACALRPDLSIFEEGDLTEIGSRGISLSGGQKARVALARAVYARTKYVLLDDPLSAVDSHTATVLLERVFRGSLCANRTVVLVTHHVSLALSTADYIVYMQDGGINAQGTIKELRDQGILSAIVKENQVYPSVDSAEYAKKTPEDSENEEATRKRPRQLVKEEARNIGRVEGRIHRTYMRASSYWTWLILLVGLIFAQLVTLGEKLWIKQWGEAYLSIDAAIYQMSKPRFTSSSFTSTKDNLPNAEQHPLFYVGIYAAISIAGLLLQIMSAIAQFGGALRASRILFEKLLIAVVRATMRWHDVTPAGRMLNRFSKDMSTVDSSLAGSLRITNAAISTFFVSVLTVIFFSPPFSIPAVVLSFIYYRVAVAYSNTARDLRRMESNTKSPIFASFQDSLAGIVTVRAFSAERKFLKDFYLKVDLSSKMTYYYWMANRWLSIHFDVLGGLAVLFTNILAIQGSIGTGLAAVMITSALSFIRAIYDTCSSWTSLELDLNAMERIVEYLELPQEPPLVVEVNRLPAYWPSNTSQSSLIDVKDLVIRYAPELPPVIHGISFSLRARERVGLLGSGKSTVAMSLLRFTDPSSGKIEIDGIDITTIGVHDLRLHITFVAQDAVLFSGTIRENIDPFGDYTDEECLDALSRVHLLQDSTSSLEGASNAGDGLVEGNSSNTETLTTLIGDSNQPRITLNTQVSAQGSNFSHGQRQLLTLARALLRRASIIILDEATSSIDHATDAKIQQTIREEFTDSLLLTSVSLHLCLRIFTKCCGTVAHRLSTIIDYDRLMVLDNGRIMEFDTPYNLIHRENGSFREMCLHSGQFGDLQRAAGEAHDAKNH